ncbi:DinB family protein [Actinomycetospora endophytica]|uniref:DinB family protein n=1 Tax=Actinomycetospora endophytica TaxID=2291215 RepID=A0ABS8P4M2_9PSEU|nr:DinB family protein [Actinomycetospora endophytica]MCD2193202.1 DinB family protein [Actinomycetospora endophytica]
MSVDDSSSVTARAVADADAALGRLAGIVGKLGDGDLHRAHRDGGFTVAQVISHINVSVVLWCGDVARLRADPDLRFFFREEIGHDAKGYPPPTVALAVGQLASTRRTVATVLPDVPDEILRRTVEIPDLGTMTVEEWTPLIIGHATGHVDQAVEILVDRDAMP